MTLASSAVYTILHPDRLGEIAASARPTRLRETKRWVTAKKLFDEARRQDRDMGVLYADAAYDCSKLIYWGKVTQMDLDAHGTSYTVTELANLTGHRTQELVLCSTGEHIAEGYLRPYAVVRTPSFLTRAPVTTMFTFGYWGAGTATRDLVEAVNAAEAQRGFEPPLWVDVRISRSVRALGFRDGAFAQLLGAQYLWMPDLGNVCVREHRHGIEIKDPSAAETLLDYALAVPNRRVIFFCSCEHPKGCHRQTVGKLLKVAAQRRGMNLTVVEWPGGEPTAVAIDVPVAALRAVARGAHTTLPVPNGLPLGTAAALPWASCLTLRAGSETLSVLASPAKVNAAGVHLKILAVRPARWDATRYRAEYGYETV
jgi:hypothetical protein